jgi:dihydrolipoamide dehydrogenase
VKEYDIAIIGSGPAGYTAAFEAVKYKMKTAIIERDPGRLGGVCLNEGCIPLKGLLHYSHTMKDYAAIRELVMGRTDQIRSGLASRIKGQGIEIIPGAASFVSPGEISVSGEKIRAKHFLIATGSSPKKIFDYPNVHTSGKIFEMDKTPGRVLIIGGGVVGCEYASFLAGIGVSVDIVEVLDSLLYGEDEEAVRVLVREFRKMGITVYTKSRVTEITAGNEVLIAGDKQVRQTYDLIFETTGRRPNTAGLGLDAAGVKLTEKGFISVDASMRTSSPAIYAAGDCIDSPMLAYTASREAEVAVRHMATGTSEPMQYDLMPKLVFSTPQVGSVGCCGKIPGERSGSQAVYKFFFKALGKAVMEGRDSGFIKMVADESGETIAGAAVVGDEITDIMNQLALIVARRVKISEIRECMFVHPSYSEIILEALHYGRQ